MKRNTEIKKEETNGIYKKERKKERKKWKMVDV